MKQLFNKIVITFDFFLFGIFQNQSAAGNVIELINKEKPKKTHHAEICT